MRTTGIEQTDTTALLLGRNTDEVLIITITIQIQGSDSERFR